MKTQDIIEVDCNGKPIGIVPAYVFGQFGARRFFDLGWAVSHVGTGKICSPIVKLDCSQAKRIAKEFDSVACSWSSEADTQALIESISEVRKSFAKELEPAQLWK